MTNCKIAITFPKFYICKYGAFYEGQRLAHYCKSSGHLYYVDDVILEKFITHYYNYVPRLYFRYKELSTKNQTTLPVEHLGIFFRKIK